jgi:hypothetical protein
MEIAIILVVLAVLGFFLWRSFTSNKKQHPEERKNPNPNSPTSETKL